MSDLTPYNKSGPVVKKALQLLYKIQPNHVAVGVGFLMASCSCTTHPFGPVTAPKGGLVIILDGLDQGVYGYMPQHAFDKHNPQIGFNLQNLQILDSVLVSAHPSRHALSGIHTRTASLRLTGRAHCSVRQRVAVGCGLTGPPPTFHPLQLRLDPLHAVCRGGREEEGEGAKRSGRGQMRRRGAYSSKPLSLGVGANIHKLAHREMVGGNLGSGNQQSTLVGNPKLAQQLLWRNLAPFKVAEHRPRNVLGVPPPKPHLHRPVPVLLPVFDGRDLDSVEQQDSARHPHAVRVVDCRHALLESECPGPARKLPAGESGSAGGFEKGWRARRGHPLGADSEGIGC